MPSDSSDSNNKNEITVENDKMTAPIDGNGHDADVSSNYGQEMTNGTLRKNSALPPVNAGEDLANELIKRRKAVPRLKTSDALPIIDDQELLTRIAKQIEYISDTAGRVTVADSERILGKNDLLRVSYFTRGLMAARCVCRLQVSDGFETFFGTGFLVSPRLLITNNHVISSKSEAQRAIAEFGYEADLNGFL